MNIAYLFQAISIRVSQLTTKWASSPGEQIMKYRNLKHIFEESQTVMCSSPKQPWYIQTMVAILLMPYKLRLTKHYNENIKSCVISLHIKAAALGPFPCCSFHLSQHFPALWKVAEAIMGFGLPQTIVEGGRSYYGLYGYLRLLLM